MQTPTLAADGAQCTCRRAAKDAGYGYSIVHIAPRRWSLNSCQRGRVLGSGGTAGEAGGGTDGGTDSPHLGGSATRSVTGILMPALRLN